MKYKNILFKLLFIIFMGGLLSAALAQPAVPTLVSPAQYSTNIVFPPTFVWDSTATAIKWVFRISTDSTFGTILYTSPSTGGGIIADTVYIYAGPSLSPSTKYYWEVLASDGTLNSTYSAPFSFTTAVTSPIPSAPLTVYPPNNTYRVADTLTFIWNKVASATSYEIQYTMDPTFSVIQVDSSFITDTTFRVPDTLTNGSPYYWRMRSINGITYRSAFTARDTFFVSINGMKGPQIPVPAYPIGGVDVYGDSTNLTWHLQYADSSLRYDVSIASDTAFTRNLQTFTSVPTTTILVHNLISDTTYYWKVRSRDTVHADTSYYSALAKFHVSRASTHPVLGYPIHGDTVYQPTQIFSWYLNGLAAGITYSFTLSLNPNLSSPTNTIPGLTSRFVTLSGLRTGKTYYWQVVSTVTGNVDSSGIDSFYVIPSAGPVVPTVSWPIGGASVYSNTPTLVWYVNSSGIGMKYDVKYALSVAGLSSATVDTTSYMYYPVTVPLLSDTTYYWQVRSRNSTDTSGYSPVDSFIVAAGSGNPVVPIPSAPIHGDSVYSNNPTFSWYLNVASAGLTYEVRYARTLSGLNSATIYSAGSSNSYTIPSLTPLPVDTIYFWQVRSKSATDSSAFCSPDSFYVVSGSGNPLVPIPSWPIGGVTVNSNPPVLNWYLNASSQGLKFEVEYSPDTSFATLNNDITNIDTDSYPIPSALTLGMTYYWKVRSYNLITSVFSGWSATQNFVVSAALVGSNVPTAPTVPQIGGPSNGVNLNIDNPELTWYLNTESPKLMYNIQYSTKSNFDNSVTTTVNNINSTKEALSNLVPGQYYWRVQSITSDNKVSVYSFPGVFTVNTITGVKNSQIPYTFAVKQNYPNPFNPSTQIEYSLPKESIVTIKVYNILGQLVNTLVNERKIAGVYKVQWNGVNNLGQPVATGVYIYRVTAGENVAVKKMILLK
ncbi:MAG: T9SS type A sorting domain-containing protein [Ignavibacteriaceae bacterium]